MNDVPTPARHRLLVIDDNPAIHEDIRKVLCPRSTRPSALSDTKALLFGTSPAVTAQEEFEIDSAFQGEEGLAQVRAAAAAGRPYALAFVDVRMPPGWDGVETITRIWREFPDLQVVICTAYSDYSWEDMVRQIGRSSSMVVLKKPFDNIEVLQLAHALTEKWQLDRQLRGRLRQLDDLVDARTRELTEANAQLKREIGERLQAERALVVSEERFAKAFQANPIPLAIQSLGREAFTDANRAFLELTGHGREELLGHTAAELGLWAEADIGRGILERLRRDRSVRQLPGRLRTRAGAVRDILLSVELIELNAEPCLLTVAQDITEQLLLEKQLRHSQKMEAIGQLAAGVAHDFNNMLTVIQGNASLALADHQSGVHDVSLLEGILTAAQRSAKLVRQLLTFSHKQVLEVRPHRIDEFLAVPAEMLPRMLGEHITLAVDVPPGLPPVSVDAGMVEQLLVNLAVNARDAMPRGGRLDISAAVAEFTAADLPAEPGARPGRFLRLQVRDTGCGIPPEVLPRIFEPFFTTKPVGQGTGLGLATAYGIARQHDGWISVASEVGRGSTFSAFFPLCAGPDPAGAPPAADAATRLRGHETVLVIEDEDIVRDCVTQILEAHGYRVITATTGREAAARWPELQDRVDLVITDVVMPDGISGLEVAQQLLAARPDLRLIFTSGYSRELTTSRAPFLSRHNFLSKPYQAGTLLRLVRECLDRPRAAPALAPAPAGA